MNHFSVSTIYSLSLSLSLSPFLQIPPGFFSTIFYPSQNRRIGKNGKEKVLQEISGKEWSGFFAKKWFQLIQFGTERYQMIPNDSN
jgi:hypothetical protein